MVANRVIDIRNMQSVLFYEISGILQKILENNDSELHTIFIITCQMFTKFRLLQSHLQHNKSYKTRLQVFLSTMATDQDKFENKIEGGFKRSATEFHDKITAEESKYTAEKGRYHLYYSAACPWFVCFI